MDTDDHDALRLMLVIAAAHRARRLLAPHTVLSTFGSPGAEVAAGDLREIADLEPGRR